MNDRAVFFEMDGTLVKDAKAVADPLKLRLLPGAAEGLAALSAAGYRPFIVSHQPGVARGQFRESDLTPAVRRLEELLACAGAGFEGFYYCPHQPGGRVRAYAVECLCRKPSPGLIEDACREHNLDPLRSWMIGDMLDDVEAGRRAGCRTVLIDNGHETDWRQGPNRAPHMTAANLRDAAARILADQSEGTMGRPLGAIRAGAGSSARRAAAAHASP